MTFSRLLKDASIKSYKAINNDGIASARAQSIALMCKHYLSKALTQLARNIEDSSIAHSVQYFEFFHCTIKLVLRELWGLSFIFHDQTTGQNDDRITFGPLTSFAFQGLFNNFMPIPDLSSCSQNAALWSFFAPVCSTNTREGKNQTYWASWVFTCFHSMLSCYGNYLAIDFTF